MLFKSLFCLPPKLSLFPLAPPLNCNLNVLPRSKIFFGLRHHSCSGRMQFQSTQGNHKATPISMVRKTMSWVFRLVRLTLKCNKYVYWLKQGQTTMLRLTTYRQKENNLITGNDLGHVHKCMV